MNKTHEIRAYYGHKAARTLRGIMAIHTWHCGLGSFQREMAVFRAREDISHVMVTDFTVKPWNTYRVDV